MALSHRPIFADQEVIDNLFTDKYKTWTADCELWTTNYVGKNSANWFCRYDKTRSKYRLILQHVSLGYQYSLVDVCRPVLQILSLNKMIFSTPIFRPGLGLYNIDVKGPKRDVPVYIGVNHDDIFQLLFMYR